MKKKTLVFTLAMLFCLTSWAAAETLDDLKKQLEVAKQATQELESRMLAQVVYGEGIANYMNDGGGSDVVVTDGKVTAQKLLGIVAYYDHYWDDKWSSSIGYSRTQVDNLSGQTDGSFKIGQYGSVNLLWYPWKSTMFGLEYLYGQREDKNGQSGEDHRIQFSFKYSFGKVFDL